MDYLATPRFSAKALKDAGRDFLMTARGRVCARQEPNPAPPVLSCLAPVGALAWLAEPAVRVSAPGANSADASTSTSVTTQMHSPQVRQRERVAAQRKRPDVINTRRPPRPGLSSEVQRGATNRAARR
jgi:hypothetical protein